MLMNSSNGLSNQISHVSVIMQSIVPACSALMINFAFGLRIATSMIDQNLVSKSEMTKIGTLYFVSVSLVILFLPHSLFVLIAASFTSLCLLITALISLVHFRAKTFRDQFIGVLSLILLKMKSGKAFRQSLLETVEESAPTTRLKLAEIVNVVSFSQQNKTRVFDFFLAEVIDELNQVDQTPHSAIQRLTVFRDRLQIENDFRHKSGQAMAQSRAQSLIMSILYVILLSFVIRQFGFRGNERTIVYSGTLFVIGSIWIWSGGKGFKWKV